MSIGEKLRNGKEMIDIHIINFTHPLTEEQLAQIDKIAGKKTAKVTQITSQIDTNRLLVEQVEAMVEEVGLTAEEWQSLPLLINLPSLNYSTAVMLALLYGRMGYFPATIRLRPVTGAIPLRFEVAEIVNLQEVRERGRVQRELR
ncbi:MAG: CRISPR-associated protein Csx15 [Syntrophomonas sp.]|uniref:CRISPR-associated protein Csx15 n=1 Tax=Syntrophomonas sp. TaxID=2053627 RepID=UPI0026214840|nr:CRISPR-associated protein Csx15 [Syntrophomonas sp.]MDD2510963.1 CRISPR-associated protein Csx15 [Syntrophomonas sp.]MDD3879183.1 CRISPR-associated protein Csx15 [Syntrophomonas sp.]MDD4626007.1 CRISPR-associated protein Csx15 [Syntrophomonas sp.]